MKTLKKLSRSSMKSVSGGVKWVGTECKTYTVEDRRPGAPALWVQKIKIFAHNFWYCPEHL